MILNSALKELEGTVKDLFCKKDDPESVHTFRIKARQLRSLLYFFKPLIEPNSYSAYQATLKNLGLAFSEIREYDVIIKYWMEITASNEDILPFPAKVTDYFSQRLTQLKKDTYHKVDEDYVLKNIKSIDTSLLIYNSKITSQKDFEKYCKKRIASIIKKISIDFDNLNINDDEAVHSLRKLIKKLRYSLKCLQPHTKSDYEKLLKNSKNISDVLGVICDCNRFIWILSNIGKSSSLEFTFEKGVFTGWLIEKRSAYLGMLNNLRV